MSEISSEAKPIPAINIEKVIEENEHLLYQKPLFEENGESEHFLKSDFPFKNYEQVYDLIKKFWVLDEESLDLLKYSLIKREDFIDKNLLNFLRDNGSGKDLRAYFSVPADISENFNREWVSFKQSMGYGNLIQRFDISLKNVIENKVLDEKGSEYKVKKFVEKKIKEVIESYTNDYISIFYSTIDKVLDKNIYETNFVNHNSKYFEKNGDRETNRIIRRFIQKTFRERLETKYYFNAKVKSSSITILRERFKDIDELAELHENNLHDFKQVVNILINKYISNKLENNYESIRSKEFRSDISFIVKTLSEDYSEGISEYLNKNFSSSSDLVVVVSANPVDFFTCSTGNAFTSCLSLKSNYSDAYWIGLHNTIVDRNRVIIYTTNKGNFKDINFTNHSIEKSSYMFNRVWGIINCENNITILERQYDRNFISEKELNEIADTTSLKFESLHTSRENSLYSKYEIDLLFTKYKNPVTREKIANIIYSDNIGIAYKKFDEKKYLVHDFTSDKVCAHSIPKPNNGLTINSSSFLQISTSSGFTSIEQSGRSIPEFAYDIEFTEGFDFSSNFENNRDEDDDDVEDDEDEDDEEHQYCDLCENRYHDDEMHYIESSGRNVCDECLSEYFCFSENHDEHFPIDDCVYCLTDNQYYPTQDIGSDVFLCEYTNEYSNDVIAMGPHYDTYVDRSYYNNNTTEFEAFQYDDSSDRLEEIENEDEGE